MSSSRRDNIAVRGDKRIKRQFENRNTKDDRKPFDRGARQPRPIDHTPSQNIRENERLNLLITTPEEIDSEGFSGLAGVDDVLHNIRNNFIIPLLLREKGEIIDVQKHMMLYGPPGTGKTELAKAMAKDMDFVFYNADLSAIRDLSGKRSTSEGVHAIFKHARNQKRPAIIFIDEADQVISSRFIQKQNIMDRPAKDALLTEMEGLSSQADNVHVVIATNYPDKIDGAFVSRAQHIAIARPDLFARKQIFANQFKKQSIDSFADDWDMGEVANLTDGYTGREIREIVRKIKLRHFDDLPLTLDQDTLNIELSRLKKHKVDMGLFLEVLDTVQARYDPEIEISIDNFNNQIN
ncbi:hypothetical protein LCGC14_0303350 [marine sediment metagenome]|uniref:AAA+ ATPase domain-containing protein n=1 Tax=marine sediment metagenome TaxID=412755 RepID=A0A0F9TUQ0_9ZZZZ